MSQVCSRASADDAIDPLNGFDEYVRTALVDWKTPGISVAIIRSNETLLTKGYGVRELGKPELVDENTVFPISSVTKVFTATGLALLVEDGKLDWADRVKKHLPGFQLRDEYLSNEVRLTDLLSHRTGLERADILAYRGDYDRQELIRRLRYLEPVAPFRDRWGYHNLMVVTAGQILEEVSGKPWEDFIRNRVFRPLRMNRSYTEHGLSVENSATMHVLLEGKTVVDPLKERVKTDEGFRRLHKAVGPAGAIHSTVADLAHFLSMYVNEGLFDGHQFLMTETVRNMGAPRSVLPIKTKPEPMSAFARYFVGCGLGWQLRDYRGRKIVYHTGSSGAVVAFMPEEKIGVAVVANRGCGIPFMVMHDVLDRLLDIPRDMTNEDWIKEGITKPEQEHARREAELDAKREKHTVPSLALSEYAGIYESDLYGKLEIRLDNGTLHLQFGPNMSAMLEHWENDTFRGQLNFPSDDWLLKFVVQDSAGTQLEVERIYWHESMPKFLRVKD